MTDAKAVVLDILRNDETLRNMLPNRNSFYRMGQLNGDSRLPAITFQDGPSVNLEENLFQSELYLRIYDDPLNGTINITPIGRRIMELLHQKQLNFEEGRFIKCKLNNTLGELEDQAIHKVFVEYQYRFLVI